MNKSFKVTKESGPVYKSREITQEEYNKILVKYKKELDEEYSKITNIIIDSIPNNISKIDKLKTVFLYFCENCNIDYDY